MQREDRCRPTKSAHPHRTEMSHQEEEIRSNRGRMDQTESTSAKRQRLARRRARPQLRVHSAPTATYVASPPYPALFTRTTVIFSNPSSNTGGFSFSAIFRITSSL